MQYMHWKEAKLGSLKKWKHGKHSSTHSRRCACNSGVRQGLSMKGRPWPWHSWPWYCVRLPIFRRQLFLAYCSICQQRPNRRNCVVATSLQSNYAAGTGRRFYRCACLRWGSDEQGHTETVLCMWSFGRSRQSVLQELKKQINAKKHFG